jgi:hypothetical protein
MHELDDLDRHVDVVLRSATDSRPVTTSSGKLPRSDASSGRRLQDPRGLPVERLLANRWDRTEREAVIGCADLFLRQPSGGTLC